VAIPAAVAVELVHDFSLLHDDVMDRDESRRHRLTAWRVFGDAQAILAGDALLTLAVEALLGPWGGGSGPETAEMVRLLCASIQALVKGQMSDISFETRTDVTLRESIAMAENKTAALLSCACALGALAAGGDADQVEALTRFGERLGLAFQVADDLQGIWGDPGETGKADYSDLRNRKKTLPVVAALESDTPAGAQLRDWFQASADPAAVDVVRVAALVEEAGGRAWARGQLAVLHADALDQLHRARPGDDAGRDLATLLALVTAAS
jgi:geranylgeranyl diphosphate synthase type I